MFGYRLCGTLPYRQGGVPGPPLPCGSEGLREYSLLSLQNALRPLREKR